MDLDDFRALVSNPGLVYLTELYQSQFLNIDGKNYTVKMGCGQQPDRVFASAKENNFQGALKGRIIAIAYFLGSHLDAETKMHMAFDDFRIPPLPGQKHRDRKELFCFPINEEMVGQWVATAKSIGGKVWILEDEFIHLDETVQPKLRAPENRKITAVPIKPKEAIERAPNPQLIVEPNSVATPSPIGRATQSVGRVVPPVVKSAKVAPDRPYQKSISVQPSFVKRPAPKS